MAIRRKITHLGNDLDIFPNGCLKSVTPVTRYQVTFINYVVRSKYLETNYKVIKFRKGQGCRETRHPFVG
jgi:hypothetical protein